MVMHIISTASDIKIISVSIDFGEVRIYINRHIQISSWKIIILVIFADPSGLTRDTANTYISKTAEYIKYFVFILLYSIPLLKAKKPYYLSKHM